MSVIEINNSDEFKKVISTGNAIVDFSANWCGPCRRIEPLFKQLAKENCDIKFVHIDVDEIIDSMKSDLDHIIGIPHFDIYHNGKKIMFFSGANLNKIKESILKLKELSVNTDSNEETEDNNQKSKNQKPDNDNSSYNRIPEKNEKIFKNEDYKLDIESSIEKNDNQNKQDFQAEINLKTENENHLEVIEVEKNSQKS